LVGGVGRSGAAPVVMPGLVFAFGVTSRMPGGAGGGDAGSLCAYFDGGVVPASCTLELFKP
jgi:hypothetical protein